MHVTKSPHVWQFYRHPAQIPPSKKYELEQLSIIAIEQELTPREQGRQFPLASIYSPVLQVIHVELSVQMEQPNEHFKQVTLSM